MNPTNKILRALILISVVPAASGCVVWDIKNNLEAVNAKLDKIDTHLSQLQTDIEPLQELDKLESISGSLTPIEEHLNSLRKTIANIDSTIPLLNISGDDDEEEMEDGGEGQDG